jgi:hypothetical protein
MLGWASAVQPTNVLDWRIRAWGYAATAAAVRDDPGLPPAARSVAHERYAAAAVAHLRRSLENRPEGERAPLLRKLPAFVALGSRPDLQTVLDEIDGGQNPTVEAAPPPRRVE